MQTAHFTNTTKATGMRTRKVSTTIWRGSKKNQDMPKGSKRMARRNLTYGPLLVLFLSLVSMRILCGAALGVFAAGKHQHPFNLVTSEAVERRGCLEKYWSGLSR